MKANSCLKMAIIAAAILIIPIGISALQHQQAYSPRDCGACVQFKKLTHEFEKKVVQAVGDPNITPQPRELLDVYAQEVSRIFLGGPDTIPGLLEQYQLAVLAVFTPPPEPDKQQQHDLIKEFRQLTKDFEGAIAGAIIAASQDNNP